MSKPTEIQTPKWAEQLAMFIRAVYRPFKAVPLIEHETQIAALSDALAEMHEAQERAND